MSSLLRLSPLLLSALLATPVATAAAAPRSITVVLVEGDGTPGEEIDVSDVSISLSRGSENLGIEASNQLSISMDISSFADPKLLTWISKGGEDSGILVTIANARESTVYLLTGIVSRQLSISQTLGSSGGQGSLSLGSKHLTVNGYSVN